MQLVTYLSTDSVSNYQEIQAEQLKKLKSQTKLMLDE